MRIGNHIRSRRREQGLVTVIILALIILICIYVEANMRVLAALKGEIELIDQSRTVSDPVEAEAGAEP